MLRWFQNIKKTSDLVRAVWASEKEVARQLTPQQRHERLYVLARKQEDYWKARPGRLAPGQARRSAKSAAYCKEWLEERGYPVPVYPPITD